jgi:phosphoglycolate phosphatase
VDTVADIAWALNTVFGELGLTSIGAARVRDLIGNGMAQLVRRGFSLQGIELDEDLLASRLDRMIEIYSARPVGNALLYPGIALALDRLQDAGIPQAVCTNKPASISQSILETLGVRPYFTCVTGGDSTERCKPDPLPLEFTARCLGERISDGIMIGDSPADSSAARSAGMPVAIVDYGYSRLPLASIDCDYRVTDVEAFARSIVSSRSLRIN